MQNDKLIDISDKFILDFLDDCKSNDDLYLHIKTNDLVERFILLCNGFKNASILEFNYVTEDDPPKIEFTYKNDLYLQIGLNAFLPGLNYSKTYDFAITLIFSNISELLFIPVNINSNMEIELETFTVSPDECVFSCFFKDDNTKKFSVKAKELLVEDYLTEYISDVNEDERKNIDFQKETKYQYLSVFDMASNLRKEGKINECIHLLEYEYPELNKDARANNLLSLCYSSFKNYNEAIYYVNKAIELDSNESTYFYNKGLYLFSMGLTVDCIKCLNQSIKLEKDEKYIRLITKTIVKYLNPRIRLFILYSINNNEILNEYMLYFDTILNLQYCFQELKDKVKNLKNELINYYYDETYRKYNTFYENRNYDEIISRCRALLNVKDIEPEQKSKITSLLKDCTNSKQNNEKISSSTDEIIYYENTDFFDEDDELFDDDDDFDLKDDYDDYLGDF